MFVQGAREAATGEHNTVAGSGGEGFGGVPPPTEYGRSLHRV